jgi:hypothetical protein
MHFCILVSHRGGARIMAALTGLAMQKCIIF